MSSEVEEDWDQIITPSRNWFYVPIKEIYKYRDLLGMFILRDFKQFYKQTILGPLWFLMQPLMTMAIYVLVFGNIARLPSDNLPRALFYLSGITAWGYFSLCLNRTSTSLRDNKNIFSKVYFPRIILPLSIVISNLLRFSIQFILLLSAIVYYVFLEDFEWHPSSYLWLLPIFVFLMATLGFSLGLLVSALTTIYRDMAMLVVFSTQLLMWLTTVVYPLSYVPEAYKPLVTWNPMTHIIEGFRMGLFSQGTFQLNSLLYVFVFTIVTFFLALIAFNRVERNFVDTI